MLRVLDLVDALTTSLVATKADLAGWLFVSTAEEFEFESLVVLCVGRHEVRASALPSQWICLRRHGVVVTHTLSWFPSWTIAIFGPTRPCSSSPSGYVGTIFSTNTTAILAALSSRSGHLQAWVGVMCPSWPRGMHSVSRVVHFEQQPVNCGFVTNTMIAD